MKSISSDSIISDLYVYSPEEYIEKIQGEQMLASVLLGVNNSINSRNAGRSSTNISGTINGQNFNAYSESYDESRRLEILQRNQEMLNQKIISDQLHNAYINSSLLKKNTVYPDMSVSGKVMVKNKKSGKYIFNISYGRDVHRIELIPIKPSYKKKQQLENQRDDEFVF